MSGCSSGVEEAASRSTAPVTAEAFLHGAGGNGCAAQGGYGGVRLTSSSCASLGGNGFPILGYAGGGFAMEGVLPWTGGQTGSRCVRYGERTEVQGTSRPQAMDSVRREVPNLQQQARFANIPMHYQLQGKDPCHKCSIFSFWKE